MPSPYLVLGRTVKAWGLKGEVKVQPFADSIAIAAGSATVYLRGAAGDLAEYIVERVRLTAGSAWIMQLQGVQTIEQAAEIGRASCRGKSVDLGGRRIIKKK